MRTVVTGSGRGIEPMERFLLLSGSLRSGEPDHGRILLRDGLFLRSAPELS